MKIKDIDILVTKVEVREKKDSKEKYLMISFLDLNTGDMFEVLEKDIEYMSKLSQMMKYKIDLKLTSSKYGLRLEIIDVKEEGGSI